MLLGGAVLMGKIVPGGFVPAQDKEYLISFAQLPNGASLDRTEQVIRQMTRHRAEAAGRGKRGGVPGLVGERLHEFVERGHRVRDA